MKRRERRGGRRREDGRPYSEASRPNPSGHISKREGMGLVQCWRLGGIVVGEENRERESREWKQESPLPILLIIMRRGKADTCPPSDVMFTPRLWPMIYVCVSGWCGVIMPAALQNPTHSFGERLRSHECFSLLPKTLSPPFSFLSSFMASTIPFVTALRLLRCLARVSRLPSA